MPGAVHAAAVRASMISKTRLVLAETIANPLLQVANLAALAEINAASSVHGSVR